MVFKQINLEDTQCLVLLYFDLLERSHKVDRCLARYSPRATTTSQPTNRAPNEPAMVRNANFGVKKAHFGPYQPIRALLMGWLVVVARGLYLERHLFTL